MTITHNEHKEIYESVNSFVRSQDGLVIESFINKDDMLRCINTDDMWCIQWYTDTPVFFCTVYGSSLELILEYIENKFSEDA
jgi:hypothetical protein